jgi:hypothetical protein
MSNVKINVHIADGDVVNYFKKQEGGKYQTLINQYTRSYLQTAGFRPPDCIEQQLGMAICFGFRCRLK